MREEATFRVKSGLAEMLKGGVIMDVTDAEQARIAEDAGAGARAVGFELARELIEGSRSRAAGIYVIPPFKEPDAALELLRT